MPEHNKFINLNFNDAAMPETDKAFQGQYMTRLRGKDLMIPGDYQEILKAGGVVTAGRQGSLMIFGRSHWQKIQRFIHRQDAKVQHIYRHLVEFDGLKEPGSYVTLNDDLIKYAGLRDEVVMIGVIYYAEIYDKAAYFDAALSNDQIKQLALAIR